MTIPRTPNQPSQKPFWQKRGIKAKTLWPLSQLFNGVRYLRAYWLNQVKTPWQAPVPVVIVGNITAGGAGKTPTTIALITHLLNQGFKPAVISRGYGRIKPERCLEVRNNTAALDAGDEPLLIKRRTGVPVFVAAQRTRAIKSLLEQYPQTDVIIGDDGLQHYALGRDIEIIVFDDRGIGNGWLIPAGPLREPLERAKQADLILYNAQQPSTRLPGYMANRTLGGYLRLSDWLQEQTLRANLLSGITPPQLPWLPMQNLYTLQHEKRISIAAAAGIGDPARFFNMLQAQQITLAQTQPLPDHYDYPAHSFDTINADIILITEKDAAKCAAFKADKRLHVVTLSYEPEQAFFNRFDELLEETRVKRLAH